MPYGDPGAVTQSLLGGSHALWLANSPSHYIPTMTFHDPMAIFLAAGSKDPQLPEARLLARLLRELGQLAVVTEVPGATHTWHGARAEIPYALTFASQHLTATIEPLLRLASRPPAAHAGGTNPRRRRT
jgi:acetyl esterase/lipase